MGLPYWMQIMTFCIALLGAALGIINTWTALRRDRIRVRVEAFWMSPLNGGQKLLAVKAINLGYRAVSIHEMGFAHIDGGKLAILGDYLRQTELPYRLEAGTAVAVRAAPGSLDPDHGRLICAAYAETADGRRFIGAKEFALKLASQLQATAE